MLHNTPLAALAALCLFHAPCVADNCPDSQSAISALCASENPSLAASRGWLKYLAFRAEADQSRHGEDGDLAAESRKRLAEWIERLQADPDALLSLRGPVEWAYESSADGSGQPFKINIPTDYDPAKSFPLQIYIHGYSGNHMEHSTGMVPQEGMFELSVLGRARGGFYVGLSEADVLDAVRYVTEHWNIDPARIMLTGGSMGGWASYAFGARYPHMWASARPTCGFGLRLPPGNLLTLPIYSTHSDDDPVVSVISDRGIAQRVREMGGMVVSDETTGLGHAAWDYVEGNARAAEWARGISRPNSREVCRIDYTAMDGRATRGWWVQVERFGPECRPARIVANAAADNTLYITTSNVARLRLLISESPADMDRELRISVDGGVPFAIPAPLPASLVLSNCKGAWAPAPECTSPVRARTPGGAMNLFDGSPILIVRGTQGNDAMDAAILRAASAASASPGPGWFRDDEELAPQDGISHRRNLYGRLPVKADSEVSDEDLSTHNIVLIGTAEQNSVAARLAPGFPVQVDGSEIKCSDGLAYASEDTALALVHNSPAAPGKLVLWFASDEESFYQQGAPLSHQLHQHGQGTDLLVMQVSDGRLVCARNFTPDWQWQPQYAQSPALPDEAFEAIAFVRLGADAFASATRADFAIVPAPASTGLLSQALPPGVREGARFADMALLYYIDNLFIVHLSGEELLRLEAAQTAEGGPVLVLSSGFDASRIEAGRDYRVAIAHDAVQMVCALGVLPQKVEWTGVRAQEAIESAAH